MAGMSNTEREKARILEARRARVLGEAKAWRERAEDEQCPKRRAMLLKVADADDQRLHRRTTNRRRIWRGR